VRKTIIRSIGAAALLGTAAAPALAVDAARTVNIAASADVVWAAIGDFCGIAAWHPVVAKCEPSVDGNAKLRKLTTKDGAVLLERELAFEPARRSYSYSILESPLPVAGYRSTIRVEALGPNSRVVWDSVFQPKDATAEQAQTVIEGIYQAGLDGLKANVESQ
jgi:hypothetical protein